MALWNYYSLRHARRVSLLTFPNRVREEAGGHARGSSALAPHNRNLRQNPRLLRLTRWTIGERSGVAVRTGPVTIPSLTWIFNTKWLNVSTPKSKGDRVIASARDSGKIKIKSIRFGDATESLFSDEAKLLKAEEWRLRLDFSANKASEIQARRRDLLDLVKNNLMGVLPDVEDIQVISPTKEKPKQLRRIDLTLAGHSRRRVPETRPIFREIVRPLSNYFCGVA